MATVEAKWTEDSGSTVIMRIVDDKSVALKQADITSITRDVFDLSGVTPETAVSTVALTIANVVFDTLQKDAGWTADSTGYNFKDAVPASVFATGNSIYKVQYKFTPASGEVFYRALQGPAVPVHGN